MKEELAVIAHELKRLRNTGTQSIYLSDSSFQKLSDMLGTLPKAKRKPASSSTINRTVGSLPKIDLGSKAEPKAKESKSSSKDLEIKIPPPPILQLAEGDKQMQWKALKKQVLEDEFCNSQLKPNKKIVFGVGDLEADIFFCGEAPGADEEIQAEPFVGPAGQLLTKIIGAMGLSREKVYIGNIMNYRPPMPTSFGNRPPSSDELNYCLPYLQGQLAIVKPKVIVTLGKTATDGLLGPDPKRKMGAIRGKWFEFAGIPLIPTFHPSYLLRNNSNRTKRMVWEDMLKLMERLEMPISEKQKQFFT